ncbi:superantigen-like protein SSL4 [Kineosporia babensis]|uniref:Uncharacterized protein n=1 Tax=Kineosporia babensis TaxID=499548 RepID=A0A9X1NDP1_9ACTN|nr:hypothetical protein [Kineosporia babensis]MCD5311924.1 hypothetical protein [Kineosporia babensis]
MNDEEVLGRQLRSMMDGELAFVSTSASAWHQLVRRVRRERRVGWVRPVILLPVGAAAVVATLVLSVQFLFSGQPSGQVVPAVAPTNSVSPSAASTATPTEPPSTTQPTAAPNRPTEASTPSSVVDQTPTGAPARTPKPSIPVSPGLDGLDGTAVSPGSTG